MIVMKFGGTSVGDPDRIRRVAELVSARVERRPLVVVSALSGVTNRLLAAADAARERRGSELNDHLAWIRQRHLEMVEALALPGALDASLHATVEAAHGQIADLTRGIALLGECTARTRDAVASIGELVSHRIVAAVLVARGIAAEAIDPRQVMRTDATFGEALADTAALAHAAREIVAPVLARGVVAVTGGFVGAAPDGSATTLGRGGSDLSATLLGVALEAEEVEIWTDVDGMMTADPRVVPTARTLPDVTFREAAELAYFGAKVLHPATIKPAVERRIPVRVLNTFRPGNAGTVIGDGGPASVDPTPRVRAVAWKTGITIVSVDSPRMLGASGFLARVFGVFERHRTSVDVVTTSEVSVSMTVDRPDRVEAVAQELATFCDVRVEPDLALACVVGRGFLESPALSGSILSAVHPAPLRMASLGSSDINLSLVVPGSDVEDVVRRLHARFLEDPS